MTDIITCLENHILQLTLNRVDKHNAFDDDLLKSLHQEVKAANQNPDIRVIILKANGQHFSAGADLAWMQRMANFSEKENQADAMVLAETMHALFTCAKPTLALIQGAAFGGGAGLVAACDMAIAAENARFCFSEVKLGLIPAVISPYVIHAIGARAAQWLFMSAEPFNAKRALELHLIQQLVPEKELSTYGLDYALKIAQLPPLAVQDAKALVQTVHPQPIDTALLELTASLIAKKRVSDEAQRGLKAFLNKETIRW